MEKITDSYLFTCLSLANLEEVSAIEIMLDYHLYPDITRNYSKKICDDWQNFAKDYCIKWGLTF